MAGLHLVQGRGPGSGRGLRSPLVEARELCLDLLAVGTVGNQAEHGCGPRRVRPVFTPVAPWLESLGDPTPGLPLRISCSLSF